MMKRQKSDRLDRMLSSRLSKALGTDERGNWLEVRELAGMSRATWYRSRRRVLFVAGVLVLFVGACAGSTGVIPWRSSKPGPHLLPICKPSVLKAKMNLERGYPGTRRSVSGFIFFTNSGRSDCALIGQPKVSLIGGGASSVHWRALMPASVFSPRRISPHQTLIARAKSGEYSTISFTWDNWCGPGSGTNGFAGKPALRFEVPNGSTFVLPVNRLPFCDRPGGWSTLRFDPKGAEGALLVAPDPPLRAEILGRRLTIRIGHPFRYRVALTNTSAHSFNLRTCPPYGEYLLDSQGVIAYGEFYEPPIVDAGLPNGPTYVLNCNTTKVMKPGERVVFAMELNVNKGALETALKKYRSLAVTGLPIHKRALDETTTRDRKSVV